METIFGIILFLLSLFAYNFKRQRDNAREEADKERQQRAAAESEAQAIVKVQEASQKTQEEMEKNDARPPKKRPSGFMRRD